LAKGKIQLKRITRTLLDWYQKNKIQYPWRLTADPYRIWLSEILLQQTRIPVALPFFNKIVAKYPSLEDVARESQESFVAEWSGIGYYSRARNMHATARELVSNHQQQFPSAYEQLTKLPGIGRYTAGALRNVCFDELSPAIDGNTGRVLARITLNDLNPASKEFLSALEKSYLSIGKDAPPADFFQALMELGEQICLPQPDCLNCPVHNYCLAFEKGMQTVLPRKKIRKRAQPYYWYFLLLQDSESFYLLQNSRRNFLRDAWLFPDLLVQQKLNNEELISEFENRWGIDVKNLNNVGSVSHSVTFRKIEAIVIQPEEFKLEESTGRWISREALSSIHTSSVLEKILLLCGSRLLFQHSKLVETSQT
jgi:A/G-specific adenine glycosylase